MSRIYGDTYQRTDYLCPTEDNLTIRLFREYADMYLIANYYITDYKWGRLNNRNVTT
jgi:hypothetical protein